MSSAVTSSRSGRRLNATGRARRAKRAAGRRNRTILVSAAALALVVGAPLGIVARMGLLDSGLPGLDSAKSFLAMMTDRSPGERTKAELTKTKAKTLALAGPPHQRALPKVAKPELPKEFVAAIAPPLPGISDIPATVPLTSIGPLLMTPRIPGGGGVIVPPQAPPGGGGGPPAQPPGTPTPTGSPPAVPEPGTWATMLLGFGLTGLMIRRRRRLQIVPG